MHYIARTAVVAFTFAASFVTPAAASIVSVTYQGTVTGSSDRTGLFGIVHPNLNDGAYVGLTYTTSYIIDTSVGERITSPLSVDIHGGSAFGDGTSSPIISATFTMNGVTVTRSGGEQGEVFVWQDGPAIHLAHNFQVGPESATRASFLTEVALPTGSYPLSPEASLNWDFTAGGTTTQSRFQYGSAKASKANQDYVRIDGNLSSITIESLAAVPELSTWAMLFAGFVTIGSIAYRRKHAAATAAS